MQSLKKSIVDDEVDEVGGPDPGVPVPGLIG